MAVSDCACPAATIATTMATTMTAITRWRRWVMASGSGQEYRHMLLSAIAMRLRGAMLASGRRSRAT